MAAHWYGCAFFNFTLFVLFIKTKQYFQNKTGLSIPVNLNASKRKDGRSHCLYFVNYIDGMMKKTKCYKTPSCLLDQRNTLLDKKEPYTVNSTMWGKAQTILLEIQFYDKLVLQTKIRYSIIFPISTSKLVCSLFHFVFNTRCPQNTESRTIRHALVLLRNGSP